MVKRRILTPKDTSSNLVMLTNFRRNIMAYEKDDGPLTEEQIQAIQKAVDDKAKAEGKIPPSKIPDENWKWLV